MQIGYVGYILLCVAGTLNEKKNQNSEMSICGAVLHVLATKVLPKFGFFIQKCTVYCPTKVHLQLCSSIQFNIVIPH